MLIDINCNTSLKIEQIIDKFQIDSVALKPYVRYDKIHQIVVTVLC